MAVAFVVHPATSKQRYRYVTNIASVIVLLCCISLTDNAQCSVDGCMSYTGELLDHCAWLGTFGPSIDAPLFTFLSTPLSDSQLHVCMCIA